MLRELILESIISIFFIGTYFSVFSEEIEKGYRFYIPIPLQTELENENYLLLKYDNKNLVSGEHFWLDFFVSRNSKENKFFYDEDLKRQEQKCNERNNDLLNVFSYKSGLLLSMEMLFNAESLNNKITIPKVAITNFDKNRALWAKNPVRGNEQSSDCDVCWKILYNLNFDRGNLQLENIINYIHNYIDNGYLTTNYPYDFIKEFKVLTDYDRVKFRIEISYNCKENRFEAQLYSVIFVVQNSIVVEFK